MKNITKIICSSIFISLIGTSITHANNENIIKNKQNKKLMCVEQQNQNISEIFNIESKEIKEESEFFKAVMKYPYLKVKQQCLYKQNTHNREIERINKIILKDVLNFKNEIKCYSESYKEEYNKNPDKDKYMKYQYEVFTNYDKAYNKNNIISIPVAFYQFTGGAHGMTQLKTYNYNLLTGEEIEFSNLFKKDSNYKQIINQYIQESIDKDNSNYYLGNDGFKGVSENQTYYLEDDGIVVYFGLYEIAPYSTGIPQFKISWKELDSVLIDQFKH